MPKVLAILAEDFEEIEAVTPMDLLRRAGVGVTLAALGDNLQVSGRSGLRLQADMRLQDAPPAATFDALLLPGGPGTRRLRASNRVLAFVREIHASGKLIAAICAAPTVLHDAGVLAGRRYTAHFSVAGELNAILADQRVVQDGNLLTSRGAGTALDFGLALVARLQSEATSRDIARAICV